MFRSYIYIILISCFSLLATEQVSTIYHEQSSSKPQKYDRNYTSDGKNKRKLSAFIDNLLADDSTKRHMAIKDMRLDELYPKIEQYFSQGYLEYAKAALERVITIEKNQTKLKDARLRLAKVYYDLEEYAEAQKAYTEFAELYPGSDKTEFAKYKAVDCGCKQISECDRDQKSTRQAAKIAKDYLSSETCQEYRQETKALCELCYDRLLDHELYVAEFHINRGKYTPAQKRIEYAKKHYLPELPEAQAKIAKVEDTLKQASPSHHSFSNVEPQKSTDLPEEGLTKDETSSNKVKNAPGSKSKKVSFVDRF